jgi:hypothetical protein
MNVSKLNQEGAFRIAVADDIMSLAEPAVVRNYSMQAREPLN